jgi:hypothetical protein
MFASCRSVFVAAAELASLTPEWTKSVHTGLSARGTRCCDPAVARGV